MTSVAKPGTLSADQALCQSLATGAAGDALLAIERAITGSGDWPSAHAQVELAVSGPVDVAEHVGLYYGAPAISFILHAAGSDGHPRYRTTAAALDGHVLRMARRRLETAERRALSGEPTTFREFDLFYGLTGIGALLLRRLPGSDILADILRYLTGLTRPRLQDGLELPGWWVGHDPDPIRPTPGGHANLGLAHGAAGLLALLAIAVSRGCVVDDQLEAIEYLCAWFDRWQQDSALGPWWPQWLTRDELRTGRPAQAGPGRPSWCYGAVGIARAQQLAGIAADDPARRAHAEDALTACLANESLRQLSDAGLCHGLAGVCQVASRAACDAITPALERRLPALAAALTRNAAVCNNERGLLTGTTGVALALDTARHASLPRSEWDACLLIT